MAYLSVNVSLSKIMGVYYEGFFFFSLESGLCCVILTCEFK
jgi:hypothetical protein